VPRADFRWIWLFALAAFLPIPCLAQNDPVAELSRHIEDGTVKVRFDENRGYLPWLLEALDVPPESQMLVFSKTSFQALLISPSNPRTLYFNDSVIVGSVKGGPVELAAQDPKRGIVFYLLDQKPFRYQEFLAQPKPKSPIAQRADCLTCHQSKSTLLPETLIRSVTTARNGNPLLGFPVRNTDIRTPFTDLWGGWFVTGKIGSPHRGNTVMNDQGKPEHIEPPGHSDIAALVVFEHQMQMMNLIARAAGGGGINELADYMLFTDEAPLPGKVEGLSGFAEKFMARGKRDSKGRSLRDLDLNHRLLRYPCSYMIYSPAFDALPVTARRAVYQRMLAVLAARDAGDRRAIVEILRDTKSDLPDWFALR
jgi:hypothetical protein